MIGATAKTQIIAPLNTLAAPQRWGATTAPLTGPGFQLLGDFRRGEHYRSELADLVELDMLEERATC